MKKDCNNFSITKVKYINCWNPSTGFVVLDQHMFKKDDEELQTIKTISLFFVKKTICL